MPGMSDIRSLVGGGGMAIVNIGNLAFSSGDVAIAIVPNSYRISIDPEEAVVVWTKTVEKKQ